MDVKIVNVAETRVATLEHRGAPDGLDDSIARFIAWRKASGLSPVRTCRTFGVCWSDPETPPADFRFDICGELGGETAGDVPPNPQGIVAKVIPAGRCALFRHRGPHDSLGPAIHRLRTEWLPASGETVRDFPVFLHYRHVGRDVAKEAWETDVYLPLG